MKQIVTEMLRKNNFVGAIDIIKNMVALVEIQINKGEGLHDDVDNNENENDIFMSQIVDEAIQAYTDLAFSTPYQGYTVKRRLLMGMKALRIQLSSQLSSPYNTVPKRTMLNALKALTSFRDCDEKYYRKDTVADIAFRILQRLINGRGVREAAESPENSTKLHERDFNMVLNAYANVGRMFMANRVITLQEKTKHAPPLSPVTYSILFKGYGRLEDLENVKMIVSHAESNQIEPDTIMLNSLIDAYINCNEIQRASEVFDMMKAHSEKRGSRDRNGKNNRNGGFGSYACPKPNKRTYNTILKGLANTGSVDDCLSHANDMKKRGLWDDVTTNTLVHAAVVDRNLSLAKSILSNNTASISAAHEGTKKRQRHPNVEAYTELIDAYAKSNELDEALDSLRLMKSCGVEPNEVTYTCLIAGFARDQKVSQAWKMLSFMSSAGYYPTSITYNAFISGLLESTSWLDDDFDNIRIGEGMTPLFDENVDEALRVLRAMCEAGIRPNPITMSILIHALGRCSPSRTEEAKTLLSKLRSKGMDFSQSEMVVTSMVQACGFDGDLQGALQAFRYLRRPDTIAINTFIDACCRCNRDKIALETFRHYFGNTSYNDLYPDVVTYSVLITALLQRNTIESSNVAVKLYKEMRATKNIRVDKVMVDMTLKSTIRSGRLKETDIKLAALILRDGENLNWKLGQLERRKRAIRSVVAGDGWQDKGLRDLLPPITATEKKEDDLFKRKGWNEVDSGFRFWDGGENKIWDGEGGNEKEDRDDFLESKGWNDVDSGFRLF